MFVLRYNGSSLFQEFILIFCYLTFWPFQEKYYIWFWTETHIWWWCLPTLLHLYGKSEYLYGNVVMTWQNNITLYVEQASIHSKEILSVLCFFREQNPILHSGLSPLVKYCVLFLSSMSSYKYKYKYMYAQVDVFIYNICKTLIRAINIKQKTCCLDK